jgi:PAS domain-containing protein
LRDLPELFHSPVKARSLAFLFCAGGLMAGLTIALPHDAGIDELGLGLTACAAALVGAALLLSAERVATWQLHVAMVIGTAMVALANEFAGVTSLYPLLFAWPILYAFYFLDRRAAFAHVALAALAYAIVLVIQDPPSPYVRWLLAIGPPVIAGGLIFRLLDRLRAERVESGEREALLEQNEARTRIVLDSAPDAFVAIDREGVIRTWNAASCAWPPTVWRSPSTMRGSTSGSSRSPKPSSAACCPNVRRTCPASRWPPATCRPQRRPRSEATGTTCCRSPAARSGS